MTIPAGPEALDAAWIEDALRRGGRFPSARVRRVSTEIIGAGYGWVSTIARVTLEGDDVPASFVAKWCSKVDADVESRFRYEIAPRVDVATVGVLGVSRDAASDRALLLLEDAVPARQGDSLFAVTDRDADVLVDAMVALHAPWWNRVDDLAPAWLPQWSLGTDVADRVRRTEAAVAPFLHQWGDRLSPAARAAVLALPSSLPAACDALARAPRTLIHGDFHVENVLFRADGAPVVLDWTDVSRGAAAVDFARFLLNARDEPERRGLRRASAPRYVRGLAAAGVAGYGLDALSRDVAHALTVALALEVRTTVRTDVLRPSHPHVAAVLDLQVRGTAEAAAEAVLESSR